MFSNLLNYIHSLCMSVLWPCYKWLVHQVTGQCELERICAEPEFTTSERTRAVDLSLASSKHTQLNLLADGIDVDIEAAAKTLCLIKKIKPERQESFLNKIKPCIQQSVGYRKVLVEVEELRATQYSSKNPEHEEMLLELWHRMMPGVKLSNRVSKQWNELGFQGDDPKTDFRGMGMLGLTNLLFFAKHHEDSSRKTLSESHHPRYGYSYAIVGINITSMIYHLLADGHLKVHFYNLLPTQQVQIVHVHHLFCYLFSEFSAFWLASEPRDIMEFNRVRDLFQQDVCCRLAEPRAVLTPHF